MRKKTIIAGLLAVVSIAVLFWATSKGDGEIKVLATATVDRGDVRSQLEATGIVKAQVGAIVKIGAQATGRINHMHVKVGDHVTQGDLIAEIDDREIKASRTEVDSRLDQARAELARVRTVSPLKITEAEAELAAAEAEARYAEDFYKRQQHLAEKDLIARDTLEDARQAAVVKTNTLRAKTAALARVKAEYSQELSKARKAVVGAQAVSDSIHTRQSYTKIITPITGIVSQVSAQEGETVVTGLEVANLITVLDPSRLEMWIYVDETDVGQVTPGLPVEFQVDAYPKAVFKGTIDQIYPEPEIRDNIVYYQALVRLDGEQAQRLRPEMTTQCQVIVQVRKNVLTLPNAALKWVDKKQVVFVVDGQDVRRTSPTLGLSGVTHSEILEGLTEGDKVATQLVLPGQKKKQGPNGGR